MKKIVFFLNLLLIALVQISDIWYLTNGGLWRKGLTSFGFVLLGILNLAYLIAVRRKPLRFPVILTVGLVFAMLADIVLNVNFIGGALLFAVGHVFYFVSYGMLERFCRRDILLSGVIFTAAALILTFAPMFDFGDAFMNGLCIGYALVISFMVGKAVSNVIRKPNTSNILLAAGSVLFFFSDLMLALYVFGDAPKITDILCVVTYYPAQCILAHAMFWYRGKHPVKP